MTNSILIIDDELFIRQSLNDFFKDSQWITFIASSGEEALEILEQENPAAAIVDVRMMGMSGDEFIRQARQVKPEMFFVICTGSPEYKLSGDILQLSQVSEHIYRKPIDDMDKLEKHISNMISI